MLKELKADWFVKDSVGETLKNILTTADLAYLKTVQPAELEKLLVDEVRFLAPYDKNEEQQVKLYIHQHLTELYQFMQALA